MESAWRRRGSPSVLLVLVIGLISVLPAPVVAGTNQISGVGVFDEAQSCPTNAVPPEFLDFTVVMDGDLVGCWYTNIVSSTTHDNPSGIYQEVGEEIFVGTFDGEQGSFQTTYHFNSKWENGLEVHGRCEHPIVAGSGTGGFEGVTGRVDFKDDVVDLEYDYRGHLKLP